MVAGCGLSMKMSRIFFSAVPDARVDHLAIAKSSRAKLDSEQL